MTPSLFDDTYRRATGTEDVEVVLWCCPADDHDCGGLFSYWAEPRCSTCGEVMERSEDR